MENIQDSLLDARINYGDCLRILALYRIIELGKNLFNFFSSTISTKTIVTYIGVNSGHVFKFFLYFKEFNIIHTISAK